MRITSYREFRKGRVAIARLAAQATADTLHHLDTSAGPGGSEVAVDPEYQAFRKWFQGNVFNTTLGVLSKLLATIDVDIRGTVRFDLQPKEKEQSFDQPSARIKHLCTEIAGLQKAYGQLFPEEVPGCEKDMLAALAIDMSDPEQRIEGLRLLGELQTWFIYAQQGMRLFRNDADAQAKFDEVYQRLLIEAEADKAKVEAVAAGDTGTPKERAAALDTLLQRKREQEATICDYQEALSDERQSLQGTLASLSRLGTVDSVDPGPSPSPADNVISA